MYFCQGKTCHRHDRGKAILIFGGNKTIIVYGCTGYPAFFDIRISGFIIRISGYKNCLKNNFKNLSSLISSETMIFHIAPQNNKTG